MVERGSRRARDHVDDEVHQEHADAVDAVSATRTMRTSAVAPSGDRTIADQALRVGAIMPP
ncbi:hypothetical protein CTI14_63145 [Methylobacterium radiotolerans]|nr:hypothetical protein CTI14_63145 [Methylobacterium radiotolerans]